MRLVVRCFLLAIIICCPALMPSRAGAQSTSADCDAIKNRKTPFELSSHTATIRSRIQSYRGKSDDYVVCKSREAASAMEVGEFYYVHGRPVAEALTTTFIGGKITSGSSKVIREGVPLGFDQRSDLNYRVIIVRTDADGVTNQTTLDIAYKFKSVETMTVSSCALTVIKGEGVEVDAKTGKSTRRFHLYFPDLKLALTELEPPVIDGLSSTFAPMTKLRPCPSANS